ncbi:MAG: tape measure protein [Gilliamella sp.]|uniref:tape measure protein n=1 Tax=Gilliamella sp. TaxID=1891236 RepID=UPI002609D11D|nr:tape measure protein [Gilliamella sp.]MCO6551491.1 tape measure protein [Gilliamella sp.]
MAQYTDGKITYTVSLEMKELLENSRKTIQELKELNSNGAKASKGFDRLEASVKNAGGALGKLTAIAKAVSAALVSSTVIAYAQSWNELEDRIQNTGATASQTKDILDQLLATSDRNGRTIEESSELYIRLSNSMGELGYSTQSTLSYIDTLSNLMTINKTSAIGAESAINALTKAQMKGKLAGIDAMSVFNAMPSVLKTLGKQLNKTEAEVRKMASDGKLSMSDFTDAMIAAQEETAALADNMRNTVTDGINRVTNNLKKYLGELNNSTGATKVLVDSLILMSQHVDILMTGVGALAAIYAGKYITSLANATKQSAEKVIENIKLATSERNLAKEELRSLEIEGKKLTARRNELVALKAVTTSKIQLAAIEKQLNNIDKQRTLLIDKEALAQTRLASATKLSTLAANGLKSAMALLGGPAGLLLLTAGALVTWSSKAAEAKQKALELTDEVAALAEKYKGLSKAQREVFAIDLKKQISEQNKAIEKQIEDIENINNKLKINKKEGKNVYGDNASLEERKKSLEKILAVMIEGRNKAVDLLDEVIVKNYETANSTDEAAKSGENLAKSWDKASQSEIDKKLASLSKELDIAQLKAKKNSEAAFVLDGLYSALGDSANEYREDLVALALGQTTFTKLTDAQVIALQPLIAQLRVLSAENNKIKASNKKGTTKSYAEEVKELSDKLEVAKLEAKGMTVEAELLAITQKMGSKVTAKQTEELRKLIETSQAYKALGTLQIPIDIEEDSFKKSKKSLDVLRKEGEIKTQEEYDAKLEQLERQHQINMAKIKSDAVVSKIDDAVAQVDPVQALKNENTRKLALIQEFENQKWITEENAIALREAANHQYEQNRINAQWEIWRNQSDANEFLASSLEGLASSATSTISGLMSGTMTATQAMQNFANVILNEAIGSLVQMGMQYVKNAIVAKTTSAATTAAQLTEAAALTAAYTSAAIQASIATQGAAATAGSTAYTTAMGTMRAAAIAGARKNGGPVDAGSMYRVGEGGKPEILVAGGKQYLIPGENGRVLSNRQITSGKGGGSVINMTFNTPIHLDGNGGMSEQDGQQLAKNIEQAIRAQIMKEQRPGGLLNRR